MQKTLTWISPHRAALVMAVTALVMVIILGLLGIVLGGIMQFAYASSMVGNSLLGVGAMLASWLITPLMAYVFTYLYCVLFNFVVRQVGGIEVRLEDSA